MAFEPGRGLPYQATLRVLGAYLDRENSGRFTVIEVGDGFVLLLRTGRDWSELRQVHLKPESLAQQANELLRGRKWRGSAPDASWGPGGTTRQNFMRALGYELDQEEASGVLIDELEDGVLVTYSFLDPSQGYQYQKRMVTLRREQIDTILGAAEGRRAKQRRSLLRL